MKKKVLIGGILILALTVSGCSRKSSTTANTPATTDADASVTTGNKGEKKSLSSIYCECGSCNETLATCGCPQAEKQKKALGL